MKGRRTLLTQHADIDLSNLYCDVATHDSRDKADILVSALIDVVESLDEHPDRGSFPKELMAAGNTEFRQVHVKPCRIIYRLEGDEVVVYLIADGRRDFGAILSSRLLRGS